MFWNIQGKYCIVCLIELLELEPESAFVALSDLSFVIEHCAQLLIYKLLRVFLLLFSHLIFIHFFIHILSHFLCVTSFHLIYLVLCHVFLGLFSFLFLNLFFLQYELSRFDGFIKGLFQRRKKLLGRDPMRRYDDFTIVTLKSEYIGNYIIFTAFPFFAGISCEIEFFKIG